MGSQLNQFVYNFSETAARAENLPVPLVRAIILAESGGNTSAWRPEPHYRWLINAITGRPFRRLLQQEAARSYPPDDFPAHPSVPESAAAEWTGQRASWGLMQIMGAVAREYGFDRHFPLLCQPVTGITYGCMHLAHLRDRFLNEHGWAGVAAAYNAGSPRYRDGAFVNQAYVNKIAALGGLDHG